MRHEQFTPEKIIALLLQDEVELAQGKRVGGVCRGLGIQQQSYYRWRSEYGGPGLGQSDLSYRFEEAPLQSESLTG